MNAPAHPPAAHPPADDHAHEEKKTFGQRLLDIAVKVLLVVIFLFVLGALLDMLFPAGTTVLRSVSNGLIAWGRELLGVSTGVGIFTLSAAQILLKLLFLAAIAFAVGKLFQSLVKWGKT